MESELIAGLLTEASNPETKISRLAEIWETTKSSRVRKAISLNPSCDAKLLAKASRLYIKEVLGNPSIEIMGLFAADKFTKMLYDAYTDPATFCTNHNLLSIKNTNGNRINIARALLVSPELRGQSILQSVCATLSGLEFSREIKDPVVRDNVKVVAGSNPSYFTMGVLLFLMNHGILNLTQIDRAMSINLKKLANPSYYTSRAAYVKFISQSTSSYSTLLKFFRIHAPHNCKELIKSIKKGSELLSDENLRVFGDLYTDCLYLDALALKRSASTNMRRYGFSYGTSWGENQLSYHLSDLLWRMIAERNIRDVHYKDLDLQALYDDICAVGFDKSYGPFSPEVNFKKIEDTLTGRLMLCEKLLNLSSDEALEFFVRSEMMDSTWYARGCPENVETRLVERLNRINQRKFENSEPLLFNMSTLNDYETITIGVRRGTEYRKETYDTRETSAAPPISGRLSEEVLLNSFTPLKDP